MHGIRSLHHGLQGQCWVPIVDSPGQCIHNHGHAVVPNHAPRVIRGEFPNGKLATVFVHPQHAPNHVPGAFWLNPCQQGVQGAVGVPQAEHRVVIALRFLELMHLKVGSSVPPIHVACQIGNGRGVVQRGVKGRALVLGSTIHQNSSELVIPAGFVGLPMAVKIKPIHLGFEVAQRALGVAETQGDVDVQLIDEAKIRSKHGHKRHFLLHRPIRQRVLPGDFGHLILPIKRLIERHRKMNVLFFRPILRNAVPHKGVVVEGVDAVMDEVVTVSQVNDEHQRVGLSHPVTVDAYPRRGGELHVDVAFVKGDGVVACMGSLTGLLERAGIAITPKLTFPKMGAGHE